MGLEMIVGEEHIRRSGRQISALLESLGRNYADSLSGALKELDFNFVITDPRRPGNPVVHASAGFCSMSGHSQDEVLGRNCRFLQGAETDRRTVLELRDAVNEERAALVRILNYSKERRPFWNLLRIAPVFSSVDGTVVHFVGVQTPLPCDMATSRPERRVDAPALMRGISCALEELCAVGNEESWDCAVYEQDRVMIGAENRVSKALSSFECGMDRMSLAPAGEMDRDAAGHHASRDACKPQQSESCRTMTATSRVVSTLVESSKGKGEIVESRGMELSDPSNAVLSSSLLLTLSRVQQSFVLTDPNLSDAPIVHASDLFLQLTGYKREEVLGRNCRFLQGPETDPTSVAYIRESIRLGETCSTRLLNYRKNKRPFWNFLHISPVRNATGQVVYFVGVQLQVFSKDEEEQTSGMSESMQLTSAAARVRVAMRGLQGSGLRRTKGSCSM
uniref:Putative LOV domain-containing protein n=1 Tax=Radula lindenbergiana TaxID=697108 RepID=A0A126WVM9_9MARC|nr:putative LOV domain-containing protein [Radula lindenbergiana]